MSEGVPPIRDEDLEQVVRDALERYWKAVERADAVERAWIEAERPLIVAWANGTESEAPLHKLLRECERDCERLARAIPLPPKRPGRKPVAVIGPASPALKLGRSADRGYSVQLRAFSAQVQGYPGDFVFRFGKKSEIRRMGRADWRANARPPVQRALGRRTPPRRSRRCGVRLLPVMRAPLCGRPRADPWGDGR